MTGPRSTAPYDVSLLTAVVVAQLQSRVELVVTWPVNSSAALAVVLDQGVNGVISDEPAALRSVLATVGRPDLPERRCTGRSGGQALAVPQHDHEDE